MKKIKYKMCSIFFFSQTTHYLTKTQTTPTGEKGRRDDEVGQQGLTCVFVGWLGLEIGVFIGASFGRWVMRLEMKFVWIWSLEMAGV